MGLIIGAASLIGISASDKLKSRADELEMIVHMLEETKILIRYKAMTVFDIVQALKENVIINQLDFIKKLEPAIETPFYISWEKSIVNMQSSLKDSDKKLLKSFGRSLGSSDIDGQLSNIEVYKEDFARIKATADNEFQKKSRLYRSLGVLSGMFLSIMLI